MLLAHVSRSNIFDWRGEPEVMSNSLLDGLKKFMAQRLRGFDSKIWIHLQALLQQVAQIRWQPVSHLASSCMSTAPVVY